VGDRIVRGKERYAHRARGSSSYQSRRGVLLHPSSNAVRSLYGQVFVGACLVRIAALTGAEVDLAGRPNGLREALKSFFATHGGEWEFRAQLLTDREKMPVEDASIVWPEDLSPYIPIARLSVLPQSAHDEVRHQRSWMRQWPSVPGTESKHIGQLVQWPIGSVMRARKPVYVMSSQFRAEHNHCPISEPRSAEEIVL
jgi:hypothetical protein